MPHLFQTHIEDDPPNAPIWKLIHTLRVASQSWDLEWAITKLVVGLIRLKVSFRV